LLVFILFLHGNVRITGVADKDTGSR